LAHVNFTKAEQKLADLLSGPKMTDRAIQEALDLTQSEFKQLLEAVRKKAGVAPGASLRSALKANLPKPPKPSTKSIIDTTIRHQVYLEQASSGLAQQVKEASQKMVGGFADWVATQKEVLGDLTPAKLRSLLIGARDELLTPLLGHVDDVVLPYLAELTEMESLFFSRALDVATTKEIRASVVEAAKIYKEAFRQPIPATGELLEGFVKGWAKNEVQAASDLISRGFAQGWTNQQTELALRGTKAANYSDGLVAKVGNNADAIVRTAVRQVSETARDMTWAANADIIEKERVVATLDGRTTPYCRFMDGKEFPLGEGPTFPAHVRCRTTKVAVLKDEYASLSEGAQRASMSGPAPATQTYYEWLGDQPD